MNKVDQEYFRLINLAMNGRGKTNRTGIDTIGVFGEQAKFDVSLDAFPILTTKRVWFKGIVHELLWFIKGDTNIKYLVDNDVHIWDSWAYKAYTTYWEKNGCSISNEGKEIGKDVGARSFQMFTQEEFIKQIKEDSEFAEKWGELGEGTYGSMWRDFPIFLEHQDYYNKSHPFVNFKYEAEGCVSMYGVDQLQKVIDTLKTDPDSRKMIVSSWHPYWVDHCALPPCHCMFHFNTEELTNMERCEILDNRGLRSSNKLTWISKDLEECNKYDIPKRRLNLLLYQRSCDSALGVPFNITSYSLLLAMAAHCTNMIPGVFTHTYGDLHIYENHLNGITEQLSRDSYQLPGLWLNPDVKNLFDFKYEDIKLVDYKCHPTIKLDVAV